MRSLAVFAAPVLLTGLLASPASAEQNSLTLTTPAGTTGTIQVADYTLQGPDCQRWPITATFTNIIKQPIGEYTYWRGDAFVAGSSSSLYLTAESFEAGNRTVTDEAQVCPSQDPPGMYSAQMELYSSGSTIVGSVPLTFMVKQATATLKLATSANRQGTAVTVRGTIPTARGPLGLIGTYKISTNTPKKSGGSGKWVSVNTYFPDSFGTATSERIPGLRKWSLVRVTATCDNNYCTPATVTTTVR